ncbi:MAG TPA: ATP-binding cassette domain-containing protein [Candidatus Acidoferrales bacterium]|nr:ATP-binding cassette domain-containing protein [Candidatus Acidoferrales bacterium]
MATLEVRGVTVRYGTTTALDDISMAVGRGEIVGILGPNGAGKTTLLDVIGGTCRVDAGSIRFDGADITMLSADRRARVGLARTFQAVDLIPSLSVEDNVVLGCQARQRTGLFADGLRLPRSRRAEALARREAGSVMESLSLTPYRDAVVTSLPLGMRRMVEVARALCLHPSILLLDEVGSGMEGEMLRRFSGLLSRLAAEGVGVLLIEHDVEFVLANCDFIYVLSGGRVLVRGTAAAVRRNPLLHDIYLGRAVDEPVVAVG